MTKIEGFPGFYQSFSRLAVVNILSNLMVPLAGLVDVAFLGHLSEIRHLAGVAIATVLFNYIYWTFGFLRMGTTGTVAQAVGRGDRDAVVIIGLRNGLLAVALGLAILVLQYPLRELGFRLLSATPEVKAAGLAYYNAMVWGAVPTLTNFVLIGWFLGQSKGGQVLLLSAIANVANIGLNYIFIVRWGWESAGAGWGTALSQYAMLAVGVILLYRDVRWSERQEQQERQEWRQQWRQWRTALWNRVALIATFSLSSDIVIRTFALITTFALFTNFSSALGTTVLAANTLLLQVITFSAYFIDGVAFATESFSGLFRGRGLTRELVVLLKLAGAASLAFGVSFAVLIIAVPTPLFSLLTSHTDVIQHVRPLVGWLLPVLGFGSIAYMLDGYFLGLTEGKILRTSSLLASLVGFAPMAIASYIWQSEQLLWLALTCFMAARAITLSSQIPKTLRT